MSAVPKFGIGDDDHLFMTIASLVARRSDCRIKVGACIVNEQKQIVGIGYNKYRLCPGIDDFHAEDAAFANASQTVDNCTLYVTRHPCHNCAKLIVQYKIKEVFYIKWKKKYFSGAALLRQSKIPCEPYSPPHHIKIDYTETGVENHNNIQSTSNHFEDETNNETSHEAAKKIKLGS